MSPTQRYESSSRKIKQLSKKTCIKLANEFTYKSLLVTKTRFVIVITIVVITITKNGVVFKWERLNDQTLRSVVPESSKSNEGFAPQKALTNPVTHTTRW